VNKELEIKIIDHLKRLEKNEISPKISSKKKSFLLFSKNEYEKINESQKECQELFAETDDKEEKKLLLTEIKDLERQKEGIIEKIKAEIIEEESISQNIIMEIRPGPGGDEAGLFVRDLYQMYANFAEKKGWKTEIVEKKVGSIGNFDFIAFLIRGESVYNYLKNEAGVHRVQRIPKTGKGEKHTSTATVVILPEPQDIVLDIAEKDIKIETCRSGGAGGQHVNTTDSAVKVTYTYSANGKTETITATSQAGRSQHDNRARALTVLKSRLWEKLQTEKEKEIGNLRSTTIGKAERSEKFRTYNFQSNRVVDKRLKMKLENKLDLVMKGNLEEICQKSIDYEIEKKISAK
jgi:peptide chain release factor 1